METVHICNDKNNFEGYNFSPFEFWQPTINPVCIDFDMPKCLLDAVQVVRTYFNQQWQITSVLRPLDPLWSPHINGTAVDSICEEVINWAELLTQLRNEFKNWQKSELVDQIVKTGCNVLLIENGCMHLSVRDFSLNDTTLGKIYIGEWEPEMNNPQGINIAYSFNNI